MDNQQKQQVLEQIKGANNVLVAVSANPTVDELAASVGLTLALNKMNKRAVTVFSGVVPSTIEFLQPEQIFESTTDSLRDFIIALDKSKADKLRYKVEDDVVRIFITPYRTTISDKDLEFSHGDFNVDVVVALGVTRREDLDKAITAHGRILHDATVLSLTKREQTSELGTINWQEQQASSLCEMVASTVYEIQGDVVDGQMATALLTGIIAETDRFKNDKTTPVALSLSSQLMSAGANQQLIAEKLDAPEPAPSPLRSAPSGNESEDGSLEIDHVNDEIDKIHIDEHGNLNTQDQEEQPLSENLPQVASDDSDTTQTPTPATPEVTSSEANPAPEAPEQEAANETTPLASDTTTTATETPQSSQPSTTQNSGQELFDNLAQNTTEDPEGQPTSKTPEANKSILTHGKTIEPPEDPSRPAKSDKPFDLQAALSASNSQANEATANQASDVPITDENQVNTNQEQTVNENTPPQPPPQPQNNAAPAQPVASEATNSGDSLADLEKSVGSTHAAPNTSQQDAQAAVEKAATENTQSNTSNQTPVSQPMNMEPPKPLRHDQEETKNSVKNDGEESPPPVPPPMTPQFYDADGNNANPFLNPGQQQ